MWKLEVDNYEKMIDIIPRDESHEFGRDCWCSPKVKNENNWLIFTHNSIDGREYIEDGHLNSLIN